MPTDRSNTSNGRPLKPTLASTRTRSAKTPLTPRLAPSASSTQSSRTARGHVGTTPRLNPSAQDDTTPGKSLLNANVTPRSSARKSRVGVSSANSTPSSTPSVTPNSTRPASTVDFPSKEQGHGYTGLGYSGSNSAQSGSRPRSVLGGNNHNLTLGPRLPLANIYNHGPADTGAVREASPMFFHANDAKAKETAPPAKKAPIFFYANGDQDESCRRAPAVPSPPLSSVGRPASETKFFHLDSLSEARSTPPMSPSPEPWADLDATQRPQTLQPPSPSKENIHLSYRKGASQIIRPNLHSRPSTLSIISGHSHTTDSDTLHSRRRSSAASAVRLGHGKSASLSSIDSVTSLKKAPSSDIPHIVPSPLHHEKRVVSSASLPESVASTPNFPTESILGLASPSIQSPALADSGKSALERMNELAANARRERKVLDLEISNSSLLAINRQLEKEVRKQKAELRRYRRMTRAGRFSADTATSTLEGFSAIAISELGDLSDMSEAEGEEGEEEEEEGELEEEDPEYTSESSFDEGATSPTTLAERDAAHRLRDEKRLQIDLLKHRELLVDSQKMNQSLKRCLNWTEELIKDAQKALAYQVRVSDVKLGGRVLSSEEQHEAEDDAESKALLSPWTPPHRASDPLDDTSLLGSERTDRDSGVDVDGMKPITYDLQHDLSSLGSPLTETPSRPSRTMEGLEEI